MIIIDDFRVEDAPAAAVIEKEIFSEPWSEKSFAECAAAPSDIYIAARCDGKLVGYCGMWCVADEGQITNVAVSAAYRRMGIARRMLNELIERGIQAGCRAFTLEVRVSNEPAKKLYKELGFESAGIRKNFYSHPAEDADIMWKYI